jgi:hypothetical protein
MSLEVMANMMLFMEAQAKGMLATFEARVEGTLPKWRLKLRGHCC